MDGQRAIGQTTLGELVHTHIFSNELSTIDNRVKRIHGSEVGMDEHVCLLLARQYSDQLYKTALESPVVSEWVLLGLIRRKEGEPFPLYGWTLDCRPPC